MPKTISFHNGSSWSRGHNMRDKRFVKEQHHIDKSLSDNNIILVDEFVRKAYDRIFGEAVAEYNAKQKRSDRCIDNYYNKIKNDKKKHIVYECIVQIGDKDDTGNNAELEKEALKRFVEDWEQRNPNLKLIGAYIHADEPDGTVHIHIDYIPVAECTRGMKLQNSLDKALQQQGFKTENIHKTAQIAWQESERKALIDICKELGIDVHKTPQGITKGREHLSKAEYQQLKETAKRQMEWELLLYQSVIDKFLQAEPSNVVEGVPVPTAAKMLVGKENKDKLLYSPSEIEKIQQLAKAVAVMYSKNKHEEIELFRKSSELMEWEDKAARTVNKALQKEQQAEQQLQQAAAEATAIKSEADDYAAKMRTFYTDSSPYIQSLNEQIQQLQADIENVTNEKISDLQEKLKNKSDTVEWLNNNRKDLKNYVNEQRQEIDKLKNQIRELLPYEQQNGELSERIRTLEEELSLKENAISKFKAENSELSGKYATINSLYDTACEVGGYICGKIGLDFEEILDKRLDGYRLSYIIDEGHNRGAR